MTLVIEGEHRPGRPWFRTRSTRRFGRRDLSLRVAGPQRQEAVVDLSERFIGPLAGGDVVADGEDGRIDALPPGGRAHHRGHLDDAAFNNAYLELGWPQGL